MLTEFYLIISESGSIRTTKFKAKLAANEISMLVGLEIPDILFQKPQLQAKIVIDEKKYSQKQIDTIVIDNIKDTIEENLGAEVKLKILKRGEKLEAYF